MSAAASEIIAESAWAKVNLYLHVVARHADGYHELDTLMVFTDLADRLEVAPSESLVLEVDGPFGAMLPKDQEANLVVKAARKLAEAAGLEPKAQIRLTKNLPVAAGLGSGSADAAAALRALAARWGVSRDSLDLAALGRTIGSDVPACVLSKTVRVGGTGEKLDIVPPVPEADIVLVNPGVELSTQSVFEARKGGFSPPAAFERQPGNVDELVAMLEETTNDLTDPAIRLCPVVSEVLSSIEATQGCRLARMSGSGATCFGLYGSKADADAAAAALQRPGWWVGATRLQ